MSSNRLTVQPEPSHFTLRRGHLRAGAGVPAVAQVGVRTPRLDRATALLRDQLERVGGGFEVTIDCRAVSPPYPALDDDESYRLEVGSDGISIDANTEWGVLRGLATLRLLVRVDRSGARAPCVSIDDAPRFSWRGLMLDPARRFQSVAAIERTLDGMALVKLNVLHLHLSDDQGFRFEGSTFPELARAASSEFYSSADLERIVAYAADRGIRVVPEIDMPGHCTSWLAAHPEWTSDGEQRAPSTRFGVHRACLDPSRDLVYEAISRLLADVARVFPDRFIHVGGDEVDPTWWTQNDEIRRYMAAHSLDDVEALHAHFNARMQRMVKDLGRRMIGWDEIAHADLPKDTVVQSWRGAAARDRAIGRGFDCIFSSGYYVDLFYPADIHYGFDPQASDDELTGVEARMRSDPRLAHVRDGLGWATEFNAAARVPDTERAGAGSGRVLGGEACLWSELVDERCLDLRLWERLPAIAERLWSKVTCIDVSAMRWRLAATVAALPHFTDIDVDAQRTAALVGMGLTPVDRRHLAPLLDAVECVKWYARLLGERALRARVTGATTTAERPYRTDTALDRFADFLPVESPTAAKLDVLVDRLLRDPQHGATRRAIAGITRRWRQQHQRFNAVATRVGSVAELSALSAMLGELADITDRAVERCSTEDDAKRLSELAIPSGEYVLAVVHPLHRLVTAT